MNDLRQQLKRSRRVNIHHRRFIPDLCLYDLLSKNAVIEVLKHTDIKVYQHEELATNIVKYGRKIFAILVLNESAREVLKFVEKEELRDDRLPFTIHTLRNDIGISDAGDFEETQWEVLAPTFRQATLNRIFRDKTILPFISGQALGQGAFGKVFIVKLDPMHQQPGEMFPERFVQKELGFVEDHRAELHNLSILNHLCHPNITKLLASFTHEDRHSLLFPLTEHGDLAQLLQTSRQDTPFEADETILVALAGLASAVEHVHEFFGQKLEINLIGCHHDLRPRNVLISNDTFILADFGICKFREVTQDSATMFRQGIDDYLAPECEDLENGFQPLTIRRSSDIWSFGCMILELATYLLLGPTGVKEFKCQRHFRVRSFDLYYFHHGPEKAAQTVIDWVERLNASSSRPCCLLVALACSMLKMTQSDRPRARDVACILRLIVTSEKAASLEDQLRALERTSGSFDTFLELQRFSAWQHVLGIPEPKRLHQDSVRLREEQFTSILKNLNRMKEHVAWRRLQAKSTQLSFSQLSLLNDSLYNILDSQHQARCRNSARIAIVHSNDSIITGIGPLTNFLDKEIRMRMSLKHMISLAQKDQYDGSNSKRIDAQSVRITDRFGDHSLGQVGNGLGSCQVLIEWRRYGHQSADADISLVLFARLNAIVNQFSLDKPNTIRALKSRCYFHDESRYAFGIIYDLPLPDEEERGVLKPITLHSLILGTTHTMKDHPTLDDKFTLVYVLARSVLEFHMVGWVHKSLNTDNVIFCPPKCHLREVSIKEPYIIGFNHSRPDDPSAFTEGLDVSGPIWYQHPTYRNNTTRYRTEYDYYSLGIILAEIGFWMDFVEISKCSDGHYTLSHEQKFMARLPRLKQYMGKDYHDAVMACIDWSVLESRTDDKKASSMHLSLEFDVKVLSRLARHLSEEG